MAKCGAEDRDMGTCNRPVGHEGNHIESGAPDDNGGPSFSSWPQDDGGGNEGPGFEASMRAKYPLFNDRRDTSTGMAGR